MQVASDRFRLDTEEFFIKFNSIFKMLQGFLIFHIPDVLADKSMVVTRQAKGVFQFRPAGQDLF